MMKVNAEQLPVYKDSLETIYHFERDCGTLQFTLRVGSKPYAEWLDWDDDAQDWVGRRVLVKDVINLIPAKLYS